MIQYIDFSEIVRLNGKISRSFLDEYVIHLPNTFMTQNKVV